MAAALPSVEEFKEFFRVSRKDNPQFGHWGWGIVLTVIFVFKLNHIKWHVTQVQSQKFRGVLGKQF
jgi:hypothetical protein